MKQHNPNNDPGEFLNEGAQFLLLKAFEYLDLSEKAKKEAEYFSKRAETELRHEKVTAHMELKLEAMKKMRESKQYLKKAIEYYTNSVHHQQR